VELNETVRTRVRQREREQVCACVQVMCLFQLREKESTGRGEAREEGKERSLTHCMSEKKERGVRRENLGLFECKTYRKTQWASLQQWRAG